MFNRRTLNALIQHITESSNIPVILVGDFNYGEIDWINNCTSESINHPATKFLKTVQDSLLTQRVVHPTRHRGNDAPSLLDLVLSSDDSMVDIIIHEPPLGLSDHDVLRFNITHE